MIRELRYVLTRLVLNIIAFRMGRYRSLVEKLWSYTPEQLDNYLDKILIDNRICDSSGERVTSVKQLNTRPSLAKGKLRVSKSAAKRRLLFERKTSGTSGTPIKLSLYPSEVARMLSVRDYCFRHYGVKLGEKEARFWGRPPGGVKNFIKNYLLNRVVCFPVGENSGLLVSKVLKSDPDYIYGYSSLLFDAAKIVEREKIKFKAPKLVVCTAETITKSQKQYISRIFGAPVAEEYGCSEFDILAFECKGGHLHLVNPWIKILERNGSLLISDVYRISADLINYEIGDNASVGLRKCRMLGGQNCIDEVLGRSLHQFGYVSAGVKIHAVNFAYALDSYQELNSCCFRYKIVQEKIGVFDIYVDRVGFDHFHNIKEYVQFYIEKNYGMMVLVNVNSDSDDLRFGKKTYFDQRIRV